MVDNTVDNNDILIEFDIAVRIAAFGSIDWEVDDTTHQIARETASNKIKNLFFKGFLYTTGDLYSEFGKTGEDIIFSKYRTGRNLFELKTDREKLYSLIEGINGPAHLYIHVGGIGEDKALKYTNIHFRLSEIRKHFPTPVFDLLTKKPQAVSEDVSVLQSEISGLKAENARLKEQLNAAGFDADGHGYRLPDGYRTECLDVIFETLKKYSPTGDKKENLKAALKQTAQEKGLYGNRQISDRNIEAMATFCRPLSDKTGGYIK